MCFLEKLKNSNISTTSELIIRARLEIFHLNVWSPSEVSLKEAARYFVTFIDDASKLVSVFSMKAKSGVFECLKKYLLASEKKNRLQNETSAKWWTWKVYEFRIFEIFDCKSYPFLTQLFIYASAKWSCRRKEVHSAKNEMIYTKREKHFLRFSPDSIVAAAYIRNWLTSRGSPTDRVPYHVGNLHQSNLSHIKILGIHCYYHLQKVFLKKLGDVAAPAILIAFGTNYKSHKH